VLEVTAREGDGDGGDVDPLDVGGGVRGEAGVEQEGDAARASADVKHI